MSFEYNLNAFKAEVFQVLKERLNDIKSPGDITAYFDLKKSKSLPKFTSCDNFILFKKIAQITLNVYQNFNIFKNIPLNFSDDELDLMPLGQFFIYDIDNHEWICNCRPDDSYVIEALYNYLLCFLSLHGSEEDTLNLSRDNDVIHHCPFCDEVINDGDSNCQVCEATIDDMMICVNKWVSNEPQLIGSEYRNDFLEEEVPNLEIGRINQCKTAQEEKEYLTEINIVEELEVDKEMYTDDYGESYINDEVQNDNECEVVKGMGNRIVENQWKCSSCELLNHYSTQQCDACLIPMEDAGLWLCHACTFWNIFYNSKCAVCGVDNDNLVIKYCKFCKKLMSIMEDRFCRDCVLDHRFQTDKEFWKCRFFYCQEWSKLCDGYCQRCSLWRYNLVSAMNSSGDVKMIKDGKQTMVWICTNCRNFNECDKMVCGNWFCWKNRFERKPCRTCRMYSDGKSNICRKCQNTV